MFDFSKITDFVSGMVGNALQGAAAESQGLTDVLANAGLDPAALSGLSEGEIMAMLSEHGIDISQFAPEELTNLASGLGLGDPASLLQDVFGDSREG